MFTRANPPPPSPLKPQRHVVRLDPQVRRVTNIRAASLEVRHPSHLVDPEITSASVLRSNGPSGRWMTARVFPDPSIIPIESMTPTEVLAQPTSAGSRTVNGADALTTGIRLREHNG
jgi:hypothetical protein